MHVFMYAACGFALMFSNFYFYYNTNLEWFLFEKTPQVQYFRIKASCMMCEPALLLLKFLNWYELNGYAHDKLHIHVYKHVLIFSYDNNLVIYSSVVSTHGVIA